MVARKTQKVVETLAKKGKRGKKVCRDCEAYVPIHS